MNNGEGNLGRLNAKDFTAEIEAATNAAVAPEIGVPGRPEVDMRGLGEKVLATPGEVPGAIFGGNGSGEVSGAILGETTNLATERLEEVGVESGLQIEERMRDDAEDAVSEEVGGFEHRIVAKNQEGVARAMMPEMERITAQRVYRPADLDKVYRRGVNATLAVFNRKIGDRN